MRLSVFGLGYVGAVTSACLASLGHEVVGVDVDQVKVDLINSGRPPVIEKDLEALIVQGVSAGRLRAVTSAREAVGESELSLICVGTPSEPNGSLDLKFVSRVSQTIGQALKDKAGRHLVVVRSTVLPGSVEGQVIPMLEAASGKKAGRDFGVASNPEFLRESTAVEDFFNPPKTVIGSLRVEDGQTVARLYEQVQAPLVLTSIRLAEMVKYVDNVFHALKITFGNEIGNLCHKLDLDSHEVMSVFCLDTKLNLSPAYLKPGFAFGGSCLPKDLRALTYLAQSLDLDLPVLKAIYPSNRNQIALAVNRVAAAGKRKIAFLGFAFKAGTDDLRESPIVDLIETLLGKGYDLKIYDRNVNLARLIGANRAFIESRIPHISRLMVDRIEEALDHAEVVIIGNREQEFLKALARLRPDQRVLDLVRLADEVDCPCPYEGLSW